MEADKNGFVYLMEELAKLHLWDAEKMNRLRSAMSGDEKDDALLREAAAMGEKVQTAIAGALKKPGWQFWPPEEVQTMERWPVRIIDIFRALSEAQLHVQASAAQAAKEQRWADALVASKSDARFIANMDANSWDFYQCGIVQLLKTISLEHLSRLVVDPAFPDDKFAALADLADQYVPTFNGWAQALRFDYKKATDIVSGMIELKDLTDRMKEYPYFPEGESPDLKGQEFGRVFNKRETGALLAARYAQMIRFVEVPVAANRPLAFQFADGLGVNPEKIEANQPNGAGKILVVAETTQYEIRFREVCSDISCAALVRTAIAAEQSWLPSARRR